MVHEASQLTWYLYNPRLKAPILITLSDFSYPIYKSSVTLLEVSMVNWSM